MSVSDVVKQWAQQNKDEDLKDWPLCVEDDYKYIQLQTVTTSKT